jgi:dTDP-4-amino-4,6-dideoxygalactose transaminase
MIPRSRPFLDVNTIYSILKRDYPENPVKTFEEVFSLAVQSNKNWMTHQGRDALAMIFHALRLQDGEEVIVPNLICRVVIDTILKFKAVPVIADINPNDFNILVQDVEKKINEKTRAIIAPHLYGIPCDIKCLKSLTDRYNCVLIEDCAQTFNSAVCGQSVGTFGDFSIYSFNFDKPISLGIGGALVVNNEAFIQDVEKVVSNCEITTEKEEHSILCQFLLQYYLTEDRNYRHYLPITTGSELYHSKIIRRIMEEVIRDQNLNALRPVVNQIGWLSKSFKIKRHIWPERKANFLPPPRLMNKTRAALGVKQFEAFKNNQQIRNLRAKTYRKRLEGSRLFSLPAVRKGNRINYLRFTICNESEVSRKEWIVRARKIGVEIDYSNWQYLISELPCYKGLVNADKASLYNSLFIHSKIIHLPIHQNLPENIQNDLIDVLESI